MKVCNDLRERQFTTNSTTGKRCRYIDEFDELDIGTVYDHGDGWRRSIRTVTSW